MIKLTILQTYQNDFWTSVMVHCKKSRAVITRNLDGIITVHNYGDPDHNSIIGGVYKNIDAALEIYKPLPHICAMIRTIETV